MKKLAIVIPYYKIDFFEESIQSVAAQTNKNFTLYIGNDASSTDPIKIIEKYFKEGDYRYFHYSDNMGGKNPAQQWERILENVEEEWFQILGDDDMISTNFVEEFHKHISTVESKKISTIKISHHLIDEENNILRSINIGQTIIPSTEVFKMKYKGIIASSLSENIFSLAAFKKYKFEKIPFAWGTDDLALLTFSGFKDIYYLSNAYVNVRISTSSISGNLSLQNKKDGAYNSMREIVLNRYSQYFDKSFLIRLLNDYLKFCDQNLISPRLNLFKILLLRGYPNRYITMSKYITKINKNIKK
ncbi:Glycosyltransferase involved in cell wall bisynthesis [Chryseobacterium ureilyticum]|uniref:Glycosyltransferase involved in cell wall bisynthesis n=1 Tax=Chryseobacterium ureilyticum TaxID=373668 RepID=A0A1N7NEU0_9FLAO|nr:glycosyltransferase family A protein [Chryseobacterium ureilyticum]SIS96751.1 Glycosyltransferase involved in cell wall bisynthesis [Chryseobacterium ureilyticum]